MPLMDYALDLVGLGIGAGISLSFYVCLKTGRNIIKVLQDTPELYITNDLVSKVKGSPGFPACIWGIVEAEVPPIHCVQNPEVKGVIWRHTIREHILAQIRGLWMTDERTIDSTTRSIPFFLTGQGVNVQVATPSKLESVDLSIISEKFEPANNSLGDHLWGWMKGIRTTGTQYTEEMLVEGTRILGLGRLVMERGTLHLKPHPPLPFILTTKDKQEILEELESPLPIFRIMSIIASCGAFYFVYRIGRKIYLEWQEIRKRKEEIRILKEAKLRRETHERDLPESMMCVVCCGLRDVVLIPCQHVCVCGECALKLNPKICPVCRATIISIQPIFYS